MITVIIPTKNRPDDLVKCLQGLASQDAPSLLSRIVVVDDNSRRPYREEIVELAERLKLPLVFPTDFRSSGPACARNHAATYAVGKIIALLDDDAIPAHDWLSVIATRMNDPGVSAITGRILPLDDHHIFSKARQLRYEIRQQQAIANGGPVSFLAGGNSAILRKDFENLGGFNAAFTSMHDRELALRLRRENKSCFYIHELLIHHRHFKGFKNAVTQSFSSGYFRLLLEEHYPDVKRWSAKEQFNSFKTLFKAARAKSGQTARALVAAFTELMHGCGYVWYRARARAERKAQPKEGFKEAIKSENVLKVNRGVRSHNE